MNEMDFLVESDEIRIEIREVNHVIAKQNRVLDMRHDMV